MVFSFFKKQPEKMITRPAAVPRPAAGSKEVPAGREDAETVETGTRAAYLHEIPGALKRLEQSGVGDTAWTGDDTRADAARFYSNRRAFLAGEPDFGRLISTISLG